MKKLIIALLLIILLIPVLPVNAATTTREVRVYLYHEYPDCVFFINWSDINQMATVQIESPDGTITDSNSQNTVFSKGGATVSVGRAKSGYWTVYVTGENFGSISISGGNKNTSSTQYNAIQSFDAEIANGYIKFKWNVVAAQDEINVSITATQSDNNNRSIWNSYSANKNGNTSVSVDDLQTGLYSFTIQAYDGNAQYTLTTDEPLYVKQSNSPAKLEGVKVGSIDGEMIATWDLRLNSSYYVTLYDYETLSVIKTEYVNDNYYPFLFTGGAERVKFSVAAIEDNVYGEFDVFEIVQSTPTGTITFPDYTLTRENVVSVNIDCLNDVTAGVYLDGVLLLENASAGDYDLSLSEGTHEVVAYIKDDNGNMKTFSKSITVDKTPPLLNLNIGNNTKTAFDNIVVGGSTEPYAVVTINGVEQKLGAGSFMAKLAIRNGVNPITVSAYDSAGNKSVQTVAVERTRLLGGGWTILILPGLVFVLLTFWYIYLNKKEREANVE